MGAVNQQESLSSNEQKCWFLAGLIEGEGSCCISIKKHPTSRFGYLVDPEFFIYQHKRRRKLLELAQEVFGMGAIFPKHGNPDVLVFAIHSRRAISGTVIPFLKRYMTHAAKTPDYDKFEEAIRLFDAGAHRTQEGLVRIVQLAYGMNHEGKQRQRPIEVVLDRILRGHTPDAPDVRSEDMVRPPRRRGEPGGTRNDLAVGSDQAIGSRK
jgi:hypothetical protein